MKLDVENYILPNLNTFVEKIKTAMYIRNDRHEAQRHKLQFSKDTKEIREKLEKYNDDFVDLVMKFDDIAHGINV